MVTDGKIKVSDKFFHEPTIRKYNANLIIVYTFIK